MALFLTGVAGLAAGITLMFLSMRAVMAVGGTCADGGPYVSRQSCPQGSAAAMLVGIFGGLLSAGWVGVEGASLGGSFAGVALLGWPALFGTLGWNFLEAGAQAGAAGDRISPLLCGVLFEAMAIVPLAVTVKGMLGARRRRGSSVPRTVPSVRPPVAHAPVAHPSAPPLGPTREETLTDLAGALRAGLASWPADRAPGVDADAASNVVDALERLAALHRNGSLSDDEFAAAKAQLLEGAR